MFQHLTNCHGEWNIIFAILGSIPFIGFWFKTKVQSLKKKEVTENEKV